MPGEGAPATLPPMLHALTIRNLALIEHAELRLGEGLNVISGETGGGKSLVICALELLRGEKASGALVRHGAGELQVDGEFRLSGGCRSAAVAARIRDICGAPLDEDYLIVSRIVDRQGRSRVRIGGRPATLSALRELGAHLLEIHGQGDSRALMRPEIQCETLDAFAGTTSLRSEFAASLRLARERRDEIERMRIGEREMRQRLEFLRYQHREMEALGLGEGELAELEAEHQVLSNLDLMRTHLCSALGAMQEEEVNASDLIGRAAREIEEAAAIDRRLEAAAEIVDQVEDLLADACREVQSGLARLELDPARLQEVEERLDEIHRALRRFGPGEREFRESLRKTGEELAALEAVASDPDRMSARLEESKAAACDLARRLQRARSKALNPFCAAIQAELADLGMRTIEVQVAMEESFDARKILERATEHGPCPVDIEVRINPGEPFHPLRDTASGGELARIVLAIKKTLADQDRVPLLVLDEIDAEIGGRLGLQVGRKLAEVARHHQVVIVTHLPQVAAFAQSHFLVRKEVETGSDGERTRSSVRLLGGKEIERELAAMATGDGEDAEALRQARALVKKAREGEASA
ncbi:MAG: DNA repair protein RecN [Planctomycetota bacterium]